MLIHNYKMKYLITENKLNGIILDYINKTYDVNNINWTEGFDDYGNPDDSFYVFYNGDYSDDETVFRWYSKDYWTDKDDFRVKLSPILFIEDENIGGTLTNLFEDRWRPVFIKWFEDNFNFPVETLDGYFS